MNDRRDIWNDRYAGGEQTDKPPEPALIRAVELAPPGTALDLACGTGRHALWLAAHGWRVTAIDYAETALTILRERAAESGLPVEVVNADIEAPGFSIEPGSYDLICDSCFLVRDLFPTIKQGVKRSGLFVGIFPLCEGYPLMNTAFVVEPEELRRTFSDWQIEQYTEDKHVEIIARRL